MIVPIFMILPSIRILAQSDKIQKNEIKEAEFSNFHDYKYVKNDFIFSTDTIYMEKKDLISLIEERKKEVNCSEWYKNSTGICFYNKDYKLKELNLKYIIGKNDIHFTTLATDSTDYIYNTKAHELRHIYNYKFILDSLSVNKENQARLLDVNNEISARVAVLVQWFNDYRNKKIDVKTSYGDMIDSLHLFILKSKVKKIDHYKALSKSGKGLEKQMADLKLEIADLSGRAGKWYNEIDGIYLQDLSTYIMQLAMNDYLYSKDVYNCQNDSNFKGYMKGQKMTNKQFKKAIDKMYNFPLDNKISKLDDFNPRNNLSKKSKKALDKKLKFIVKDFSRN